MAGVRIGRSAAYQLLHNMRLQGEVALQDGRYGHPAKLREPIRQWLEMTCRQAPQTPSHVVQAALQERFGTLISIGYLNRVRAELGLGRRPGHREKTSVPWLVRGTSTSRRSRRTPPRSRSPGNRPPSHPGNGFGFVFWAGDLAFGASLMQLSPDAGAHLAVSRGRWAPSDLGFARLHWRCARSASWSQTGLRLFPHGETALPDGPGASS